MSPAPTTRRRTFRNLLTTAITSTMLLAAAAPATAQQDPDAVEPRLTTPWTEQVSPDNALPEYPRPQLTREKWQNLNGTWEFARAEAGEAPPFGQHLAERILVPYPTESALSGIARHEDHMWYRRTFTVPPDWQVGRDNGLKINFGAVDYQAAVWVNGRQVAAHRGGYGAFTADVTAALKPGAEQEIIVGVEDRADATWQPVGKQRLVPDRGIFYEGASGIWQTVWMEPVPVGHIETLDMAPDIDTSTLGLTARTGGDADGLQAEVTVKEGDRVVSRTQGPSDQRIDVPVPGAKLWSPDSPFLYDLDVVLTDNGRPVDRVSSYFGMREIGTAPGADGKPRITLNGKPLFLMSTLDQGYWPDGIYTAPTDEALRFDLEQHKRLGFNTVRKHIKTEPDRWYRHADELGLLVWQDMPSMRTGSDRPPADAQTQFEAELRELVEQKKNWTSVIGWVPFNEGWGEWSREATGRIAEDVKRQDPTRLVNAHSGVNCCASLGDSGKGDVIDWHQYVGPATPVPEPGGRVAIDGEHGGFGLEVDGHMWFGEGHAYEMTPDQATLTRRYVENQRDVLTAAQRCGISGAIYTQVTDVEHEVNGFFTYDRQVEKMDFAQVRAINDEIVRNAGGGTPPAPDPGTPGLEGVHAYKFDEGSGSTASDSVGSADAALTNAGWVPGVDGSGLAFAGSGQADTGRPLINTAGSYSVSAWARLDEAGTGFQTVVSQDSGANSAFFLQYSGADQRWAMSFIGLRALSPEKPEPGRWYHLTGVRDAAAGTVSLFVDGQRVDTKNACLTAESTGSTVIGRGQYGGAQVDFMRGAVDDARIFDRALSDEEVAALANRG